jgi:hypothetical protein
VRQDELDQLFAACSNEGRWGVDDELGTLNLITPEKRLAALASVRLGHVVSIGLDLAVSGSRQFPPSAVLDVDARAEGSTSVEDQLSLRVHGFETTHVDALGHV